MFFFSTLAHFSPPNPLRAAIRTAPTLSYFLLALPSRRWATLAGRRRAIRGEDGPGCFFIASFFMALRLDLVLLCFASPFFVSAVECRGSSVAALPPDGRTRLMADQNKQQQHPTSGSDGGDTASNLPCLPGRIRIDNSPVPIWFSAQPGRHNEDFIQPRSLTSSVCFPYSALK